MQQKAREEVGMDSELIYECAVCGAQKRVPVTLTCGGIVSSRALDRRGWSHEDLENSLGILRCEVCGHASPDLCVPPSEPDSSWLAAADPRVDLLPTRLLAWSRILEDAGQVEEAGWVALHAAWASDDLGEPDRAAAARLRSVQLLRGARSEGGLVCGDRQENALIFAETLRLAGAFDEAAKEVPAAAAGRSEWVSAAAAFEAELIERRDGGRYLMPEIQRPSRWFSVRVFNWLRRGLHQGKDRGRGTS